MYAVRGMHSAVQLFVFVGTCEEGYRYIRPCVVWRPLLWRGVEWSVCGGPACPCVPPLPVYSRKCSPRTVHRGARGECPPVSLWLEDSAACPVAMVQGSAACYVTLTQTLLLGREHGHTSVPLWICIITHLYVSPPIAFGSSLHAGFTGVQGLGPVPIP